MNQDRWGATAAVAGPLTLLAGILLHPFIPDLKDNADVVAHMAADPTRWFVAHLVVAVASALVLLAFIGVRAHVRMTVGNEPWTARALTPLVLGTVLFTMLPAMEIAMLAAHEAGADVLATHNALDTWFIPILFAGSALFAVGSVLFAVGVHRARILPAGGSWTVVAGLVVSAASRFIPMTGSLMVGIAALVVAFVPLAASMWNAGASGTAAAAPTGR